jgi:putative N-acetylmannosamine-6-phosphate epimerase
MMIDVQNVIRGRLLYPSAHNAHMHMSHSNGFMYDVRSVEASVSGQSSTIDFVGTQLEHPLQPYYGQHH